MVISYFLYLLVAPPPLSPSKKYIFPLRSSTVKSLAEKLYAETSGNTSDWSLVTVPSDESLYKPTVLLVVPVLRTVGSSEIKKPKSVVLVETSPENEVKGDKSKVEVKRELKSF